MLPLFRLKLSKNQPELNQLNIESWQQPPLGEQRPSQGRRPLRSPNEYESPRRQPPQMRFAVRVVAISVAAFLASCCVIQRFISVQEPLLFPAEQVNKTVHHDNNHNVSFVTINKSSYALHAIRDGRSGNMGAHRVRVLVVARGAVDYKCRFPDGTVVDAEKSYEMSENHAMPFGVYFVNCETPANETVGGSLEFTQKKSPWVTLPVRYDIPDEKTVKDWKHQLTICLPFVFGDRYSGKSLVEFMELNRILGVEHVIIYLDESDIPANLSSVISFYENMNVLEVVRLRIPVASKQIWYHGQLVAVTDCLYRSMGVSRFVAFHDLDEFLIPQKPELLPQTAPLLALLNTVLVNNVASIRVPTQYMSLQDTGELITLKNTLQRSYTDKTLTKCVVRPEMIFEQGIHHTSRVIQDNYKAIAGDEDTLRLYHFKTRGGSKTDTRIVRDYGDRLTQRYREVVAQIGL
ncbi:hypothetical protein Y032_0036g3295 [Ancylostoma ceylanicum]|uniref:Glycosyltransferase family 92 protein n=2 Tax=Ancylostoma ceylanicum TaxID=53326 RepID=A0A016UMD9_9BILA|nr:hypothetical protein Y032_0036g3295 [Ancylostoma ceylanicum]